MKRICFLLLASMMLFSGCSGKESKAAALLETARFEEKQHNLEHARKLYAEILGSYPGTAAADEASRRLTALAAPK